MDKIFNSTAVCALVLWLALIALDPVYAQTTATDSVRICSSFERDQYTTNSSGEIWMVASDSMSPLFSIGDVVAVEKNVNFSDIRIGDIIVFKEPISFEGNAIISRVKEIITDPRDDLLILTKAMLIQVRFLG